MPPRSFIPDPRPTTTKNHTTSTMKPPTSLVTSPSAGSVDSECARGFDDYNDVDRGGAASGAGGMVVVRGPGGSGSGGGGDPLPDDDDWEKRHVRGTPPGGAAMGVGTGRNGGGGGGAGRRRKWPWFISRACSCFCSCFQCFFGRFKLCRILIHCFHDYESAKKSLWRILPGILVMKAFWLSLVALGTCDLAHVVTLVESSTVSGGGGGEEFASDEDGGIPTNINSFGLYTYSLSTNLTRQKGASGRGENLEELVVEDLESCLYPLDDRFFVFDRRFRTARATGAIAFGVGVLCMIAVWRNACKPLRPLAWRMAGVGLVACCVLQGLTMLIFTASVCAGGEREAPADPAEAADYVPMDVECTLAAGAGVTIAACAFWLLTGLAMTLVPLDYSHPPPPSELEPWTALSDSESLADAECPCDDDDEKMSQRPLSPSTSCNQSADADASDLENRVIV